jgi:hypothetical protein
MDIRKAVILYLRSNTNLVLAAAAICGIAAAVIAVAPPLVPAAIAAAYLVVSTGILFSKRGAEEIVKEQEEIHTLTAVERIQSAKKTRDRLAYLRIADPFVKKELDYFVLIAGQIIEESEAQRRFHPAIAGELGDVMTACNRYLKTADSLALQDRYETGKTTKRDATAVKTAEFIKRSAQQLLELKRSEFPGPHDIDTLREIDEA